MTSFEFLLIFFGAPVFLLVSAYLLAKNRKKIPRTVSFLSGLFFAVIGVSVLLFVYDLYANDHAIVFLKGAVPFAQADHLLGFIVFTVLNFGIALTLLFVDGRAIYRSLVNKHLPVETDLHS